MSEYIVRVDDYPVKRPVSSNLANKGSVARAASTFGPINYIIILDAWSDGKGRWFGMLNNATSCDDAMTKAQAWLNSPANADRDWARKRGHRPTVVAATRWPPPPGWYEQWEQDKEHGEEGKSTRIDTTVANILFEEGNTAREVAGYLMVSVSYAHKLRKRWQERNG